MISLKSKAKERSKRHGPKCLNCEQEAYDESKTKEKLCVTCLRKLTRTSCFFCQKSFHVLSKYAHLPRDRQTCENCTSDRQVYGEPRRCKICENLSAFESATCRTCSKSEKSYGPPVPCEKCAKLCAFKLNAKSRAKVGGRTLCYVCTQSVKLEAKKEAKVGRKQFGGDVMKQLRAGGKEQSDRLPFSKQALLEPIAMSTTTEDAHWEVLTEKFEILQRTFLEHKEQSETQIQQYIRKIFELRKELSEAQDAKDKAILKMHEKEREVGTLTGTVNQLENLHATSLEQNRTARIEMEQRHNRELADLNKRIKFLENVTPQKMVHEAKLTEEKSSAVQVKGPDSFFGAPVALGSGVEPARKRIRPATTGEKAIEDAEDKSKKKKADAMKADSGESNSKAKLSIEDKKTRKADKKERKRLKKEAKKRKKLDGVPEGDEDEEGGVNGETAEVAEGDTETGAETESRAQNVDSESSGNTAEDLPDIPADPYQSSAPEETSSESASAERTSEE